MTQPKKSHHRKPIDVRARAKEKAEYFFLVYEQMGPNRTIKRLWGLSRGLGIPTSLSTLERYSQVYGWQSRILERAARHESAAFQDIQSEVDRMNADHARTFGDIGALVKAGIMKYQEELAEKVRSGLPPVLDIDLATIGKLAQTYQYGERLARGLATSKAEVIVQILPPLVKDMFAVFLAVNVITNDPPELVKKREAEFIQRGDQVLIQYYGKTTSGALPEGRGPNE